MLNLNIPLEPKDISSNPTQQQESLWKVFIYDKLGQDLISPLLKVNELREQGITLHLPLVKDKFPITDVPAIYFVQPTLENIQLIVKVGSF